MRDIFLKILNNISSLRDLDIYDILYSINILSLKGLSFCVTWVIILNIAYYEVCRYGIKKRKNPIGITFRSIGTSYSKQIPIHLLASCEWVLHYALAFLFIINVFVVMWQDVKEIITRRMRAIAGYTLARILRVGFTLCSGIFYFHHRFSRK